MRLLASASDLVAGAGALFTRKKQAAKIADDEDEEEGAGENAWMTEEADEVPLKLSSKEQEEVDERREAGVMMADRALDEIEQKLERRMTKGDYQVQVHVIECRDLKAEDLNGLSDPYCRVRVMGRTKKTGVKKKCTSCVFDEVLYFNFADVAPSRIAEAAVEVSIIDWDLFGAHDMIGTCAFTCGAIHGEPGHELYRKWTGLVDNENADDNGYQGFVKLSVTVLGPGDEQVAHDVDREYQEELEKEMDAGDAGGMALDGPDEDSTLVFLVLYVWEAEDLPQMDASGFFTRGGIEAYVRADFCGCTVRTSSISVSGRGNLAPDFREELWVPVSEPCAATRVTVGLWDYNSFSRDRPVAHLYFDYAEVKRNKSKQKLPTFGIMSSTYTGPRPRWHNLYGAPLGIQGKRGALQNRFGDEASTYRGRVLLSSEVYVRPPKGAKTVPHMRGFRHSASAGLRPAKVKYTLRALAVLGSEIPVFKVGAMGKAVTMRIIISVGTHRLEFKWQPNARGLVNWNEFATLKGVELPVLLEELPDVCVYLQRGPPKVMTVCYARIPAAQLLKAQFRGDPLWVHLRPDTCRTRRMGGVALTANPGAVLVKLGFGLAEDALFPEFAWNEHALLKKATTLRPFTVRLYVYQARHLPASDENGLLDPYVKVRFCGHKQKTKVHQMTTAPLFYETLQFSEELPEDPAFCPDVVAQVWDADKIGSNTPMALVRMPLSEFDLLASESSRVPFPKWRPLSDVNGEPIGGHLLCAGARILKRDKNEKASRPESIVPPSRMAWVEVTMLGVRQLKNYRLRRPTAPYVRVDVPGTGDGGGSFKTRSSNKPSGRNANIIDRRTLCMEMPENAIYAPQLDLRVYNAGATSDALLGAASVDLAPKMPWNADGYVAPQMELFDDEEQRLREAEAEKKKALEAALEEEREDAGDGADPDAVAVAFGEDDAHEDLSSDGEDFEQHELEKYDPNNLPQGVAGGADHGTGAFDPMVACELPMITEDAMYQEEQERLAVEVAEDNRAREKSSGYAVIDMIEARLNQAIETGLGDAPDYKLSDLDIEFPSQWAVADYLAGREWWTEKGGLELEHYLKTKPFETYPVYRGHYHPNPRKSTLRAVGFVKAVIRVMDEDPQFESAPFFPMGALRPQQYAVRIYVIRGANLQPVDGASCDPYLRVKLGDEVQSRPEHHKLRTLKPDLYQTFEFRTTLPGPAVVKLQVKDWNRFYPVHELVGETLIDLEDRWFHRLWQQLDKTGEGGGRRLNFDARRGEKAGFHRGSESRPPRRLQEQAKADRGPLAAQAQVRDGPGPGAPLGGDPARGRGAPGARRAARGAGDAEIRGPRHLLEDEGRAVIYRCQRYEVGDYYAEFWLGQSRKMRTDIHWRCRSGRASWNWRIKLPVELPLASPELGRLNVQLWDKDIIKWNDVIGQTQLDLYRWLVKAYKENRPVSVFKEINDAYARKKAEEAGLANQSDLEGSDSDDDSDDASDGEGDDAGGEGGDVEAPEAGAEETKEAPAADEGDDGASETKKKKKKKKKEKKATTIASTKADDKAEQDEKRVAASFWDAEFFVLQLKNLCGVGPLDDTAQWLRLMYKDQKRHRVVNRGSIAISVEILPWDDAENRPAGVGISEPNQNPTLSVWRRG